MFSGPEKTFNILLVDDESITIELVSYMLLEVLSANIESFETGVKALDFIHSHRDIRLDLVISDWEMPQMNGLDFLKAFRKVDQSTPFLMLTGNATKELVLESIKAGATDFIAKPFRSEALVEKVQFVLSQDND